MRQTIIFAEFSRIGKTSQAAPCSLIAEHPRIEQSMGAGKNAMSKRPENGAFDE